MACIENFHQSIVDNMINGYVCFKGVADEEGVPADYEIVQVNPAFQAMLGLKAADITGRRIGIAFSSLIPETVNIISVFNQIAQAGSRKTYEQYSQSLKKWYWVFAYSPQPEYVIVMLTDITRLKQTEENLRESEAMWKFALEGSGDGVWDWDYARKYIFYSRQWKAILGHTDDEISSSIDEWDSRIHPDDRTEVYENLEKHLKGETHYYNSEHRLKCKDGRYKWVLDRGLVVSRDCDGNPLRIIGTKSDISARKRIENVLQREEENFRNFFNTVDEFLFVLDQQGIINKVNQAVLDRLGYKEDELVGQSILFIHPLESRDEAKNILAGIIQGQEINSLIPLVSKNGAIIPVETRAVKGYWSGEKVLFGFSKDISHITLSEAKYSRAFYHNGSLMSISTLDEGKYLEVNDSFCEKLGYRREEILGFTSLELGIYSSQTERDQIKDALMTQGRVRDYEIIVTSKNGQKLVGIASMDLIKVQSEEYLLTIVNDITERRRMSEELQKKNRQLEKINSILKLQATTDSLTQLFNHRHTMESLQSEIKRAYRYHHPLSIMMMDLDHFKKVNDIYGHQVGDEVLITTAQIIKNNLRNVDIAGRYGGEEFLLILPQTDLQNSLQVAQRIRLQIEQANFKQQDLKITISIGVAQYNDEDMEHFIKRVDSLLYLAKNNGRNRIEA